MNYYISDLHLFHKNVTGEGSNFDNRPFATLEEMHRIIKENWNKTVTNGDTVFILEPTPPAKITAIFILFPISLK